MAILRKVKTIRAAVLACLPFFLSVAIAAALLPPAAEDIHEAAKSGDAEKLGVLLEENSSLINLKDETGRTPLHWACRGVHMEAVRTLADRGADVNAQDANGVTPLHSVASRGHLEAAELLIEKGARLDVKMYDRTTPLHLAAVKGFDKLEALLVEKGSPLDSRDTFESTPLIAAVIEGQTRVVELLAESVEKQNKDLLNLMDYDGDTALHWACAKGDIESTQCLVAKGADLEIRNTAGESPWNLAEKGGYEDIAAFLAGKGADTGFPRFPKLSGPYLGQDPPGRSPRLFAKGIVSTREGIYGTIAFSPDGREAFWKTETNKLLFMTEEGGAWTPPRRYRVADKESINVPFIGLDGTRLYFMARSRNPKGIKEQEKIWFAEKKGRGWSEPRELDAAVNSIPMHWQFSMDKSGDLYLSTDNIFRAGFVDGSYHAPEKLPPPINSVHKVKYRSGEIGPGISPDGDYLIYTKFPIGLFVTFKNEDGSWTDPQSLDEKLGLQGLNSMARVTPDGAYIFFQNEGARNSVSGRSLYWVAAEIIDDLRPKRGSAHARGYAERPARVRNP